MGDEFERDYESEEEFQRDRRRLFREGGWLVRRREERERRDGAGLGWLEALPPDAPGALGCVLVGVVAIVAIGALLTAKKRRMIRVTYHEADGDEG